MICKLCGNKLITWPILSNDYTYHCWPTDHYSTFKNVIKNDVERYVIKNTYEIRNITNSVTKEERHIVFKSLFTVLFEGKCHFSIDHLSEDDIFKKIEKLLPFL